MKNTTNVSGMKMTRFRQGIDLIRWMTFNRRKEIMNFRETGWIEIR